MLLTVYEELEKDWVMDNNPSNTSAYDSSAHLLKRLETNMLACHHQMEVFLANLGHELEGLHSLGACPVMGRIPSRTENIADPHEAYRLGHNPCPTNRVFPTGCRVS